MIRKLIFATLFIGGGYYLIKKILPKFTKDEFDLDTMSIEERLALEEKLARERAEKIRQALIKRVGTADPEKLKDIKDFFNDPSKKHKTYPKYNWESFKQNQIKQLWKLINLEDEDYRTIVEKMKAARISSQNDVSV